MKSTKRVFSVAIALTIVLFSSVQIQAMRGISTDIERIRRQGQVEGYTETTPKNNNQQTKKSEVEEYGVEQYKEKKQGVEQYKDVEQYK